MKRRIIYFVVLCFCFQAVSLTSVGDSSIEDVDSLIRAVLRANPELADLDQEIKAVSELSQKAKVWPDPVLSVGYVNMPIDTFWLGETPMSAISIGLKQTTPFFGKVSARLLLAKERIKESESLKLERQNELIGLAMTYYVSLSLRRLLKDLTLKHIDLLGQLSSVVESKYRVGKVDQYQLLRVEVLSARLKDEVFQLDAQEKSQIQLLNALIHRRTGAKINTPGKILISNPSKSNIDKMVEFAHLNNPQLKRLNIAQNVQAAKAKSASNERWPDLTLSLAYKFRKPVPNRDKGTDFVGAGVAVPLTFFGNDQRFGSEIRAARARQKSIKARRQALLDKLGGEIASQYTVWKRGFEQSKYYEGSLIPLAAQALKSALAAYEVGRAQFADVYKAELELIHFERIFIKARALAAIAQIKVQTLTGENLLLAAAS